MNAKFGNMFFIKEMMLSTTPFLRLLHDSIIPPTGPTSNVSFL
jgi:hypothetical protein